MNRKHLFEPRARRAPPAAFPQSTPRRLHRAVTGKLAVLLAAALVPVLAQSTPQLPELRYKASTDIACEDTPFGRQLILGRDAEMLTLVDYASSRPIREWLNQLPPGGSGNAPWPGFQGDWTKGPGGADNVMAGRALLDATRVDLDGDGQDEVAIAVLEPGSQAVRIGLFRRADNATAPMQLYADRVQTYAQNVISARLATGNFSAQAGNRNDLALMTRRQSSQLSVTVLPGAANGGFAGSGTTWNWSAPSGGLGVADMASGDLLLEGRDQIIVVAESDLSSNGNNRKLNYHLLEVAPGTLAINPRTFTTTIGSQYDHHNGGTTIDGGSGVKALRVSAGDVAGDAAAELVVHMEFQPTGGHGGDLMLGQRVHHFDVYRGANNAIIDVQLARPAGAEPWVDYDFSHIIRTMAPISGDWDVAVANIDDEQKAEIVFAHNRNESDVDNLYLHVFKVSYHLTAAFRYHRSGRDVQFRDISVGGGPGPYPTSSGHPRWVFSDNGATSNDVNPTHRFSAPGTYNVTLNIREDWNGNGSASSVTVPIVITNTGQSNGGGLQRQEYRYQIQAAPVFPAMVAGDGVRRFDKVAMAVSDMDRDGINEIFTLARRGGAHETGAGLLHSLWGLDFNTATPVLTGTHRFEPSTTQRPNSSIGVMRALAADVDGDSVQATIGADCRQVNEIQARKLIWVPPHFSRLQDDADREASIGETSTTGSSVENRFGSFTSHDVSAYIGLQLGSDAVGVQGSIKATAGYNKQAASGGVFGSENSQSLSQGMTQTAGDAMVVGEGNQFNCYAYDVSQASIGLDENSSVRICEILPEQTYISSTSISNWDVDLPMSWAAGSGGHAPPQWVPLTRDWANLALFRPVTSNASFSDGSAAGATDGKFRGRVQSQARIRPYVEIDLGSVQSISNIRVFPVHGELATDLRGFRVYASTSPMPTSLALPTGPDVREFAPESFHALVYDRWNIWTRHHSAGPGGIQPGDMMRARYIRLQHPGLSSATINISQIQVFGDIHLDPPFYPDAVCDPASHDGLFMAKVWDRTSGVFRDIEVRGDLIWNGSARFDGGNPSNDPVWQAQGNHLQACSNHVTMNRYNIWPTQAIGGTGSMLTWAFNQGYGGSQGDWTSFENSVRVGAEFDLTLGAFVAVVAGGAYEFSSGVTEEHQSSTFWSKDLEIGGGIGGFANGSDLMHCRYNSRPYAYRLVERSNTGYEHTVYQVDYVVPENVGATAWTRANVPDRCLPEGTGDRIFGNGFD